MKMAKREASSDTLQRYFDGELPEAERRAFEAALTDDDRERLAALSEMRGLLRNTLAGASAEVDVWPGIELEVARQAKRSWRERLSARRILGTSAAGMLLAAAAAFLLIVKPWHPAHPSDNCDVESLEVSGGLATVLQMHDTPHSGDATTIIWTTEEED
jgi:anti-sigma factor RsiW